MKKDVYRASEVAKIFGVSDATVSNWIANDKIPSFQVGSCRFIPSSFIKEKIEFTEGKLTVVDDKEEYRKWFRKLPAEEKQKELLRLLVS